MPGAVFAGSSATVGLSWSGLATDHRYIGGVQYLDASAAPAAATALSIDTTPGTPLDMPTPVSNGKAHGEAK